MGIACLWVIRLPLRMYDAYYAQHAKFDVIIISVRLLSFFYHVILKFSSGAISLSPILLPYILTYIYI